jgi:hypothetical protein
MVVPALLVFRRAHLLVEAPAQQLQLSFFSISSAWAP